MATGSSAAGDSVEVSEGAALLPGAVDAAASTPDSVRTGDAVSPAAADVTEVTADEPRRQKKRGCVNPVVALLRCCPLPVRNVAIHCAFYPTLGLLRLRACCCGSRIRWYDRIDLGPEPDGDGSSGTEGDGGDAAPSEGGLIQGAFPLSFVLRRLATEEGVQVVVSNTAEHDGRQALLKELKISYHRPGGGTVDFAVPTVDKLEEGAAVLHEAIATRGETCYVHCKAGKGRATCMVVAYLTKYRKMTPTAAQAAVSSARPQASYVIERPGMLAFFGANGIDYSMEP
eukprot:COSAG06_NODE_1984_length_7915_cov_3.829178_8_plen_286_part_00